MSLSIQITNFSSVCYDSCTICYTQLWNINISFISIASEFQHWIPGREIWNVWVQTLITLVIIFDFVLQDFRIHYFFMIVVGSAGSSKDKECWFGVLGWHIYLLVICYRTLATIPLISKWKMKVRTLRENNSTSWLNLMPYRWFLI